MQASVLPGVAGSRVELDLCFDCHGIWFDPQENLKLTPAAVVELFGLIHAHRHTQHQPLAAQLGCPRCKQSLALGYDVVKSGRYITYRCPQRHGRFSAFSSFMIEKGFVRQLSRSEINDMAQRVAVIYCTSCGAPVDIRKDHACPHCRSAFSLLDPKAVEQALQGYAKASADTSTTKVTELADALVMVERDRQQALRDAATHRSGVLTTDNSAGLDLLGVGMTLVWHLLN